MDEFRVGYLGRGVLPTRNLPFMQYTFPESDQWGEMWLQQVWYDFAGDERGIVMTIWDPSRLLWFGNPNTPELKWLQNPPFQKWGYFAIDSEGVGGKLTAMAAAAIAGYDRVLAYGQFGAQVMGATLGREVEWIPHGIDLDKFQPRDPAGVRVGLGIPKDAPLIGCVMTNQARKDWGLAFEIFSILRNEIPGVRGWFKVDVAQRYWDLRALAADFGISADEVLVDVSTITDEGMSYMYSTCDITMLPSLGEGFGYPIVESLACGTPCVHGTYGGGAELLPIDMQALVEAYRWDTRHNVKRPVYDAEEWVDRIKSVLAKKYTAEQCRAMVEHLNWPKLHTVWRKWFKEGLK